MIRNAVIISEDETDNSVVSLGKTVTFVEIINGKPSTDEESYTIVGSAEADPMEFVFRMNHRLQKVYLVVLKVKRLSFKHRRRNESENCLN